MSMREIKTWVARCDWCQCDTPPVTIVGEDEHEPDAPEGWGYHKSGGWGMTDYTNTELLCPAHLAHARREAA